MPQRFRRGAFTGEDKLEHLAGDLVVNLAFGDERFEGDHGCGLHAEGGELNFSLLCAAGDFAHPPLAGGCCGCTCGDGLFDDVECASVDDVAELFVGVAPLTLEATAALCRGFGQFSAQTLNPFAVGDDRYEVRFGEVTVVVSVGLKGRPEEVSRVSSCQWRVSWVTFSPRSRIAAWRRIS